MNAYVAERGYNHEGTTILGIFSTKELADEVCANDIFPNDVFGNIRKHRGDFHQVTAFEIDVPIKD